MSAGANPELRELLFGDLPPDRARTAFGAAGDAGHEIVALAGAAEAHDAAAARAALLALEAGQPETRLRLQAWSLARAAGVPRGEDAKDVLGVVVDMGLDEGLDTLAGFGDGSARYLNHSGAAVIWDVPDMTVGQLVRALLEAAGAIAVMTGVLDGPRPEPPGPGGAMISVLTLGGIHTGSGTAQALSEDPWAGAVIAAAVELMAELVDRASTVRPGGSAPG
jgi:hypothetical protein